MKKIFFVLLLMGCTLDNKNFNQCDKNLKEAKLQIDKLQHQIEQDTKQIKQHIKEINKSIQEICYDIKFYNNKLCGHDECDKPLPEECR